MRCQGETKRMEATEGVGVAPADERTDGSEFIMKSDPGPGEALIGPPGPRWVSEQPWEKQKDISCQSSGCKQQDHWTPKATEDYVMGSQWYRVETYTMAVPFCLGPQGLEVEDGGWVEKDLD